MQHRAKKNLGQNFLIDQNVIQRIVDSINPQQDQHLIEIGPGLGAITVPLKKRISNLDVIELDKNIIPQLLAQFSSDNTPVVHNLDVLKFNFTEFQHQRGYTQPLRIVGNLPYNISTAILFHLLKHKPVIYDLHFMLQKEVVERIVAPPGNRDYGRLSVMIQAHFSVSPLFTIAPECFRPAPKIQSALLRLVPTSTQASRVPDAIAFASLVRQAFSQRRKTLKNNLAGLLNPEQIARAGIDPGQRAETLSVADFARLCQELLD